MIGSMLSGRYRLESKLGSGGMSTVYLAVDETLGRHVAIKVLHQEISDQQDQLERFRREARAVAQLSHPNLVGVIDAGEEGGRPYIVFEYVPGQTLKQMIAADGRLPLDEATAYAIEIGRGLQAAHAARLIHRDVKPQNVLIDPEGRAKITDFGIALSLESHGLTATGRVLGTTDYVSPEQAMGREIDPRSDVYSLGILLYEMLTGEVPYKAETQVGVAMKHVNETVPNVQRRRPDASAVLAAAVERATAKEPRDRYGDMSELLADLEHALEVEVARAGGATGEATSVLDSVPERRRRVLTRRRISWAGVLLLAAAAAIAIAFAAVSGDEGPSQEAPPEADGGTPIEIQSATDFDPEGDGEEHEEETGLANDGIPTTSWSTEDYTTGLEGLKDGVGLYVDAGGPVTPSQMVLKTGGEPWTFEVYGSNLESPPTEIAGWGSPLTTELIAEGNRQIIDLDTSEANRWFLVWITAVEDGTPAEIFDIRLLS
jgi:serine/threonine-protein kinase